MGSAFGGGVDGPSELPAAFLARRGDQLGAQRRIFEPVRLLRRRTRPLRQRAPRTNNRTDTNPADILRPAHPRPGHLVQMPRSVPNGLSLTLASRGKSGLVPSCDRSETSTPSTTPGPGQTAPTALTWPDDIPGKRNIG